MKDSVLRRKDYTEAVSFLKIVNGGDSNKDVIKYNVYKLEQGLVVDRFLGKRSNRNFVLSKKAHLIALLIVKDVLEEDIMSMTIEEGLAYLYLFGQ